MQIALEASVLVFPDSQTIWLLARTPAGGMRVFGQRGESWSLSQAALGIQSFTEATDPTYSEQHSHPFIYTCIPLPFGRRQVTCKSITDFSSAPTLSLRFSSGQLMFLSSLSGLNTR